ncbi:MAG: hypothetical protein OXL98_05210 [Acidimicrobiaceae bacterium]|nr:hypothetical protein [Acidimicrobiaceae bacterium]
MVRTRPQLDEIPHDMAVDEFWELFGTVEHEGLDFKGGPNDSFKEAIPAMAMTDGGLLILGVDDGRNIVGCPLTQRTQDRVTAYAKECHVDVELRSVRAGGHELTIVEVPEVLGRIATSPDGRLLRRVGGASEPLRGDAVMRFVKDRAQVSAEEEPLGRCFDPADFDLDSVNSALAKQGRPPVGLAGLGRALASLQVAEYSGDPDEEEASLVVFKSAAVLFAHDPRRFVPGAEVQLIRRPGVGPGPGPASDRQSCSGPLAKTVECCGAFIERHTARFEVLPGLSREVMPEYPAFVVREALLNALAHRDYGLSGATVDITVWDDRIEFRSPGPLPGHITTTNMRFEHYSRNRRIMRALKSIGLVEEFGDGVDRMITEMEQRLMQPPTFAAGEASLTVTLHSHFLVSVDDQAWLQRLGAGPDSVEERRALVEARRAGQIARRQLAVLLPDADIDRLLSTLLAKDLFVRVGRGGGTQYELSAEVVARAGGSSIEARRRRRQALLDEMARRGSLSRAEAVEVLDGDGRAARSLIGLLVSSGRVVAEGNTRARRYRLADAPPSEDG